MIRPARVEALAKCTRLSGPLRWVVGHAELSDEDCAIGWYSRHACQSNTRSPRKPSYKRVRCPRPAARMARLPPRREA